MTDGSGRWRRILTWFKWSTVLLVLALLAGVAWLAREEMRTSAHQARFFSRLAGKATFSMGEGPSNAIRYPSPAPFDDRLGYAKLGSLIERLEQRNFEVTHQARMSPGMLDILEQGYFAPYREKIQAGLSIQDCRGASLFHQRQPERVIDTFDALPSAWVAALVFIENRELLDTSQPRRNPAVDWGRLGVAIFSALRSAGDGNTPGGSTLATQIEKYRHSAQGRTGSIGDKLQQMVSASLRAYQDGEDTTEARRRVMVAYMNTVPLAAKSGFGEVHGMGDGLWAWYGREFDEVLRLAHPQQLSVGDGRDYALLYKQVLSLLVAQRRPTHYLNAPIQELESLTNAHLRLLAEAQVISPKLRDTALEIPLQRRAGRVPGPVVAFVEQKAVNAVRTHLSGLLGNGLYALDRLDLQVESSIDGQVQEAVTQLLQDVREPDQVKALGLHQNRLLSQGDPRQVVYSFSLYERGDGRNLLRVQADNFDQPLNINEGSKLDLGSTAKLRTLVTYLDVIDQLHGRLSGLDATELQALSFDRKDVLSRWAVEHLLRASDKSLAHMLEAALERRYSASPGEVFFTGGGEHRFTNFSRSDNDRVMSVEDALRQSVNLVFIRLMRDVVNHYMFLVPGSSAQILRDADDPRRTAYLERFADQEGQVFIRRFLSKYQGMTAPERQALLLEGVRASTTRLAVIHRSIAPAASLQEFRAFVDGQLPHDKEADAARLERLYEQFSPDAMSLADRGYLAGVHPLELWLLSYLREHPGASETQVMDASATERQAVYKWLFVTQRKNAQDRRIQTMLEGEGFLEIHRQWARLGYPFPSLVPSYASALGASADRPDALSTLMGILLNDGVRQPNQRVRQLRFAVDTPYETRLQPVVAPGVRVLSPEVARATRQAMRSVVEEGTARRVLNAFVRSDGTPLAVSGKTGTGDHRFNTYGDSGQLLQSRVVNRSATFAFTVGDHFYGAITAFVPGAQAADYDFTSGLPVQLLKLLAPRLMPLLEGTAPGLGAQTVCRL